MDTLIVSTINCQKKKRERQAHISKLSHRIHELEREHKLSMAISTLQELTQVRFELVDELNKKNET